MIDAALLVTLALWTTAAQYGPGNDAPPRAVVTPAPQPSSNPAPTATGSQDPTPAREDETAQATSSPGAQAATDAASPAPAPAPDPEAAAPSTMPRAPSTMPAATGPAESFPSPEPDEVSSSQPGLQLKSCADLLAARQHAEAAECYRLVAARATAAEDIRTAAALSRLAADMQSAREEADTTAAQDEDKAKVSTIKGLLLGGRIELVLWTSLFAGYLGVLGDITIALGLMEAGFNFNDATAAVGMSGAILAPVLTAAGGAGAAVAASVFLADMSPGDTALLRSAMWVGAFNSAAMAIGMAGLGDVVPGAYPPEVYYAPTMLVTAIAAPALAIGAASFVDLPDGGVALATSAGLWTGGLVVAGLAMSRFALPMTPSVAIVAGAANLAFLGTLVASPWLPVSRVDTWALDLGAAVGLGAGAALSIGLRAPNPVLGFGTMALSAAIGGAGGFAASFFGRQILDGIELPQLPELIAAAPVIEPSPDPRRGDPMVGLAMRFALP